MNDISYEPFDQVHAWRSGSNLLGSPQIYVYCYLIDGILIDTAHPRIRKELLGALKDYTIDQILLTHHHEDHSGNVEAIMELKNIKSYGSKLCCELMQKPAKVEPARWLTWGQHTAADVIPIEHPMIESEHYTFDIIDTPGHAPDQISLYVASEGWLFSGDIYLNDYIKMYMRDEVIGDQILSLRKLLTLEVQKMFCCHQPIMINPSQRLRNKLQYLEDFYGNIIRLYQQGMSANQIMKALGYRDQLGLKIMSLGQLSLTNMVKSAIDTFERKILED